jgi:outer membrane protein assembly factor BamB
MFVDPKNHAVRLSPWPDAVASAPAALGEGVIVIDRAGQVLLVNVETGQPLAAPFVPRIAPGAESWRNPAVVAGKLEAVVSDGRSRIYRLGVQDQPAPYLTALAEEPLTTPLVSDLAVSGEFVFAADEAGKLTAFQLADLKVVKNWPLGATAIWGPMAVGRNVLVATDRELFCFDSKPDLVWKKPLPAGSPIGRALAQGDEFVLASPTGIVWRIDRQSGEVKAKIDLGQPLASGPVAFDKHLVVAGTDGSLHFIAGR